ncbi:hypothetical protein DJ568_14905 [Mucilaginibacter hurinus]|uniref:Uncharacterized protein n=1 Tax=Mucilaginibacter hurinus TaxID=2201324 RepID=A0A367GK48_9SPHI|nr:hypothetical protein [Mucilaginibacter hurinus]RCH53832.1 hypothetical protein DJ568_14905 [Mucilaginibacter hurinus]
MDTVKPILQANTTFTPYKFYSEFLEDVANYYFQSREPVILKLFENGDEKIYDSTYRIDPIAIPLLLSLIEQLSKFHRRPLELLLFNNRATVNVLEFLYRCDFFYIAGDNQNPNFPKGRNILKFNKAYLGAFSGKEMRPEHKVRAYSLDEDELKSVLKNLSSEEKQRDFLISHFTYKVREHFQDLLFDNNYTAEQYNTYIDILSELITNSVLHSKSIAFALMFVDRFKTKFSITDNGVGFAESMKLKPKTAFYEPEGLKTLLLKNITVKNISENILGGLYTIYDTLFYSSLKDRHGLFDLMLTVVLESKGYFRIHSDNTQIIVSSRMADELYGLQLYRKKIFSYHLAFQLKQITKEIFEQEIAEEAEAIKQLFLAFCEKSVSKYSEDIKYSSLRFFPVRFRGVHIEVEIPNTLENDHISD